MLPEDNPFAGRDHVRQEEVDPFDESHRAVVGGVKPFTGRPLCFAL